MITDPQDIEAVIRKMAEARDEALWKVLYFNWQRCGEIKPIAEAIRAKFPSRDSSPHCATGPVGWTDRSDPQSFPGISVTAAGNSSRPKSPSIEQKGESLVR